VTEVHDVDGVLRVEDLMLGRIGNVPVDKERPSYTGRSAPRLPTRAMKNPKEIREPPAGVEPATY
jgi:hypothetical protein